MPLIKSKSDKAFHHNLKVEMDAGKPKNQSLAIAYSMKRRAGAKKMAEGGSVDDTHKKTVGEIIGFPMAHGGDVEEHYDGIADAIMAKKRKAKSMADGGMVDLDENAEETPASLSPYDDDNAEAVEKELYDDEQLSLADKARKRIKR